jgi:hypothetical protein
MIRIQRQSETQTIMYSWDTSIWLTQRVQAALSFEAAPVALHTKGLTNAGIQILENLFDTAKTGGDILRVTVAAQRAIVTFRPQITGKTREYHPGRIVLVLIKNAVDKVGIAIFEESS